jgi:Apea-like HEPN
MCGLRRGLTRLDDELRTILADLFLGAARMVRGRLRDVGLPLTVEVGRSVVEDSGPGSWSVSPQVGPVNVLAIPQAAWQIAPWLPEPGLEEVSRCAVRLAQSARETLPFSDIFGRQPLPVFAAVGDLGEDPPPDYASDPPRWVARFIVLPGLQHHLEGLPTVDDAGEATALAFADEVIKVAHDDRLRYHLVAALGGVHLDAGEPFVMGNIRVRNLSASERGRWVDERGGVSSAFLRAGELWPPEIAVEFDESSPRDAVYEPDLERMPGLVGALQLHGYWVAGRFYRVESDPPWVRPVRSEMPVSAPGYVAERSVLTAEAFRTVMATAERLAGYRIVQPRSPQDLALHRFFAGEARRGVGDFLPGVADRNAADAVLDFTIALEALLLPYDENAPRGELGYRFRMHGAHFIAGEVSERPATARRLSAIYSVRSRLVHGGRYPKSEEIKAVRDDARDLARRGLLRAVNEGFPVAEAFNRMILGTAAP